ncbi:hypothetical protein LVJ94_30350 [Pendulispora rubella]|uniref:Uncharacterized protein n=1 Tax=Pendulispora rubella TaxID=2741070 RepID=A0ABZ2KRC3_9BACT
MQKTNEFSCSSSGEPASVTRVRWGIDQWLITDTFRREWRFWIAPIEEHSQDARVSRWDMVGEPLFHLVPQAFSSLGAREDEAAGDLLAIYDALTGSHLSDDLPRPTVDRRRRLRGFERELSRVLYAALEAGVLKFERYEVPWPFSDVEEKAEERTPEAGAPSVETDIVVFHAVRDVDGSPVPGAIMMIRKPDGSVVREVAGNDGKVQLRGRQGERFTLLSVSEDDAPFEYAISESSATTAVG